MLPFKWNLLVWQNISLMVLSFHFLNFTIRNEMVKGGSSIA